MKKSLDGDRLTHMKIPPSVQSAKSDSAWYALAIIILSVLVSLAGYSLVQQQKRFLLDEKQKEIATIADLKTSQLVQWRKERIAEGASIRANVMIAHRTLDFYANRDKTRIRQEFRIWMDSLIDLGEYNRGVIFSPDGEIIVTSSNFGATPSQHYFELATEATREHELVFSDFHSDGDRDPYDLNMAVPIMDVNGTTSNCIAILVLDIDPGKRLYPLIQSWPTTSATAETLLVKREANSVLYLNNLRNRPKSAQPFLLPISQPGLPSARAVLGQEGSFAGVDYRNIEVISATRIVPGTQWGLVTKVDLSEVMQSLTTTYLMVTTVGVVIVISLTLGLFLWNLRKKTETIRRMFKIEQKHNLELKQSEDALTRSRDYHLKLLEDFPSPVWRSGTDGRCNYFNRTWLAFTGRSLEQELDDGWADGVHPDDLEHCLATYREAFQEQRSFIMEYRLRFNDGSYRWINDHGRPYYDLEGAFAGYIGSCFDINVQKNAEAELQGIHQRLEQQILERTNDLYEINSLLRKEIDERKQLEQQLLSAKRLEAIGQIAGGVAHEVRNPLNAILTITEALFKEQEIASNPEFEPFILHIRNQVNRLVHLMNDLLDLGRTIPANSLQPVPLDSVCRDTLELWKSTGVAKNKWGLLYNDNDESPLLVSADALKLQQIFFNLLENAGFHTPETRNILIRLHNKNISGGMAVAQIVDQGTGIPEDKLPHVFDPFYTDRKGGTGLGLALVKHFVENMGGFVHIWNNDPPPGCTVEVRIPLYHEEKK